MQSQQESSEKYRLIFEHAPLGALHFDSQGIITACNDAFVEIIGSNKDALIGLNMLKLPNKEVVAAVREALEGKNGYYDGHYRSVTADKVTPVRVHFSPFINQSGQRSGGIGIIEDTTKHEQTAIEIAEKDAYFEQLFQASPEGIVILDTNDCVIRCNDAFSEMFGYGFDEIRGKPINLLIVPEHLQEEGLDLTHKAATGIIGHETLRKKKDGTLINVSILANPISIRGGHLALYGIYRDITKQKATEQELLDAKISAEQSDKLKTAFLNNLSHEVRTPMNAIMGFSNLLREKNLDDKQIDHLTEVILHSSAQLMSIIDSIVRISAIEAGLLELHENVFDVRELQQNILKEYQDQAIKKSIRLRYHSMLPENQGMIVSDETKIYQVLSMIVDNAIKYTRKGHVEFGCTPNEDFLKFYVADTGCGIEPAQHEIIFERFRQVDPEEDNINTGLGLGLPIARAYVEALGGKIWLDSKPGSGSIFYFTIPWKNYSRMSESTDKKTNTSHEPKTVLVAEDEEYNFYLTKEILAFKNIEVLHAWNGEEAIGLVKEHPQIDLVLMDIKMPVLNGYEATREIKNIRPELPVVALTAYALIGDREKALLNGCDDYLAKPVAMRDFEAVIDKFL